MISQKSKNSSSRTKLGNFCSRCMHNAFSFLTGLGLLSIIANSNSFRHMSSFSRLLVLSYLAPVNRPALYSTRFCAAVVQVIGSIWKSFSTPHRRRELGIWAKCPGGWTWAEWTVGVTFFLSERVFHLSFNLSMHDWSEASCVKSTRPFFLLATCRPALGAQDSLFIITMMIFCLNIYKHKDTYIYNAEIYMFVCVCI